MSVKNDIEMYFIAKLSENIALMHITFTKGGKFKGIFVSENINILILWI